MYRLWRMLTRSTFLVVFSFSCFSPTITTFSEPWDQSKKIDNYFIVTAYYSPVPNQEEYITGDYEWDVRLNGSWITWKSGKEVFPWMIAAPQKYAFGTKVYIEWLWTWSVEDRGGAITESSDWWPSYDRIDVWMGYGDQWRQRAILWWARKVVWYVVENTADITIKFSDSLGLQIFWTVGPESSPEEIKKLQEFLISLKMYSGLVDGNHDSIRDTIIDYQLKHGIIQSRDDDEAGYFWPKTIATIRKEYPTVILKSNKAKSTSKSTSISQDKGNSSQFTSILNKDVTSTSDNSEIKQLQALFKQVGLYKGKIDGNFSSIKTTVIDYQIKKKIIAKKTQYGAGNFGPKTRSAIKKDFAKLLSQNSTEFINTAIIVKAPQTNVWPNSSQNDIKLLQTFMSSLNIYTGSIDGKYDSIKTPLTNYQLKAKIVKNSKDDWAGYFWPKTRDEMNKIKKEVAKK